MERYRVFLLHWDSTGDMLNMEPTDEWSDQSKELHWQNRERMVEGLIRQYGEAGIEAKLDNLRAIGGQPFSIVAYHNRFYQQAREAFIIGAYYPALTAACALGERILNHLILGLRDDYKGQPGYDDFAIVKTSSNWRGMIRSLEGWGVLLPAAATAFRALTEARQRAIHFNPATAERDREDAIEALKHLDEIITVQFGGLGPQPWFIPDVAGAAYIRKDWENNPFVKLVYLPASWPVGPEHWIDIDQATGDWTINDREDYEDREITDAEFIRLQDEFTHSRIEGSPKKQESEAASAYTSTPRGHDSDCRSGTCC